MLHLIQRDVFGERHYGILVETMERLGLRHISVGIRPGTRVLVDESGEQVSLSTTNVFCWGSVKMAHIAADYGWRPGSFMNANHDQRVYSDHYGAEMLNHGGSTIKFGDAFEPPSPLFFARPCGDTKAFTGQVFMKSSWDEFVTSSLTKGRRDTLNESTAVQIAPRKDIQREFRCWVVKGAVTTASQYKIGTRVVYERCDEPIVLEYAQRMADIYCPAEAFVIDVCLTDEGMRIVEINCINCAGFYDADLQKLLMAVEEAFAEAMPLGT